ncbi:MAG TPA: HAD family hydrolase [Candidatus Dormibacteraeota bacterium]|nr:HAD family hydrolase [Candidatus Dormibacteraeota bacterium]
MKPKAIIFDCWNTLFHVNPKPDPLNRLARAIFHSRLTYRYLKSFERTLMLAPHDDMNAMAKAILRNSRIPALPSLVHQVERSLEIPLEKQQPFEETLEILPDLQQDYKLGLITNTYSLAFIKLDSKYKLGQYFDFILPSYQAGLLKPDPKIFKLMLKKLGVAAEEALMVGDSLRDDVQGAEAVGIRGILVDRRGRYPRHKSRVTSLREVKKLLQ